MQPEMTKLTIINIYIAKAGLKNCKSFIEKLNNSDIIIPKLHVQMVKDYTKFEE